MARTPVSELSPHRSSRRPFMHFARWSAGALGHPIAFSLACFLVFSWALSGRFFGYSDEWQLVINTGTTIATFLMVFLIQNSQNRDSAAMQIKLDELIRSDKDAHNALLDLEELTERELNEIKRRYELLAERARIALREGKKDTKIEEV